MVSRRQNDEKILSLSQVDKIGDRHCECIVIKSNQHWRLRQKGVASFIMIYHVKYHSQSLSKKMSMKEKRLHTDPDEVKREMQKVADELGLSFNSCRVAMNGYNVAIVRTNVFQTQWQSCISYWQLKPSLPFS